MYISFTLFILPGIAGICVGFSLSQHSRIQLKNGNYKTLTCQNLSAEFFCQFFVLFYILPFKLLKIRVAIELSQIYHRSGMLISYGLYWFSISDVPASTAAVVRVVLWPNNFGKMARVCHVISLGIRDENKMLV